MVEGPDTASADTAPAGTPPAGGRRTGKGALTVPRVLAVVVSLAIALLWIWAFAMGNQTPPGLLEEPVFAERAEAVCAEAADDVADLPPAYESSTAAERADVVDRSNTRYSAMVAQLRQEAPALTTGDDTPAVADWLDDWDRYLGDRADYAARLRTDETARFYVTDKDGDQVTEPMDRFAEVNDMPSCATPSDLS